MGRHDDAAATTHRLRGVQEQVEDDLLQPTRVAEHDEGSFQTNGCELHAAEGVRIRGHASRAIHDLNQVDIALGLARTGEPQQVADDVADPLEPVAHETEMTRAVLGREVGSREQFDVIPDPLERVVDLVCDAGGEEAEGRQSLSHGEFVLGRALMRSIAQRDVDDARALDDDHGQSHLAVEFPSRRGADAYRWDPALAAHRTDRARYRAVEELDVLVRQELGEVAHGGALFASSSVLFQHDSGLGVDDENHVRGAVPPRSILRRFALGGLVSRAVRSRLSTSQEGGQKKPVDGADEGRRERGDQRDDPAGIALGSWVRQPLDRETENRADSGSECDGSDGTRGGHGRRAHAFHASSADAHPSRS